MAFGGRPIHHFSGDISTPMANPCESGDASASSSQPPTLQTIYRGYLTGYRLRDKIVDLQLIDVDISQWAKMQTEVCAHTG
ncbi:hypothetical protein Syun_004102 [Stephania yunnanensis]|uniref:Uncharacterized protein n=1 Tax=Stephania yunnanensis TaxID=152371 RepID=A0AAP0L4Y6_9MAGN